MKRHKVFIIAEAGSNWRVGTPAADLRQARRLIDAAAESGADAVKFQTYRAETVYVPNAGTSDYLSQNGIRQSITDIFRHLSMPYEMVPKLAAYCRRRKIEFMTSYFSEQDFAAVDPYVRIHKIASYEITHPHLIRLAARSKKRLILSTGASRYEEIDWAVRYFRKCGGRDLALMQCTARYPAPFSALNLKVIPAFLKRFPKVPIGFSDHSRHPLIAPVAAVALGATLIEKHYTLDNDLPGPDHKFAVTVPELAALVRAVRDCEAALGSGKKTVLPEEKELFYYAQRAVQAVRDIPKGELFKERQNIAVLRPGKQPKGLHPRYLKAIEGKRAKRTIPMGHGIRRSDF